MRKFDALVEVTFLPTESGGRNNPITVSPYGCPMLLDDGKAFDCRFCQDGDAYFEPGKTYQIPVKFLFRDLALSSLHLGQHIKLLEGRPIATGKIISADID